MATPPAVVAVIDPLVAPEGTVAFREVDEITVKEAALPLNFTELTPVKLVPVIVTLAPAEPLVGEKSVIVGATPKLLALVNVVVAVVTVMRPVVAPTGTVAVI